MSALLSVALSGPEDAPVVVLLHAIATAGALWEPQRAVLSERFRVIVVDLPGHGESPPLPPGAATIATYGGSVLSTLNALGVAKAALVGLSFGSSIAQHVAATAPERVSAVVLAAGTPYAAPPVAEMWRDRAQVALANGMAGQVDAILSRWFTPAFLATSPLTVDRIRKLVLATSPEGYAAAAEAIASLDNRSLLPDIACPALVLAGAHDQAVPLVALRTIVDAVPSSRLEMVDAAHLLNVEAATEVTEVIGRFLQTSIAS